MRGFLAGLVKLQDAVLLLKFSNVMDEREVALDRCHAKAEMGSSAGRLWEPPQSQIPSFFVPVSGFIEFIRRRSSSHLQAINMWEYAVIFLFCSILRR